MQIRQINNQKDWDQFITTQQDHTFLHSWAWGELNEQMGDKVWRLGVYDGENLIAAAQVIKVNAKAGNYLFVPHGPVFATDDKITNNQLSIIKTLTAHLRALGKEENVNFIRISPLLKKNKENLKIFAGLGFKNAPIYMHAETTWQLPLNKNEEDLLMGMRKNTRNLVRRAQREGVEVVSGKSDQYISEFLKLYKQTAGHHGFVPFSDNFIKKEVELLNAPVYLAKYKGEVLATAIIPFYGASTYYHHGATSANNRKIPAAYLLQWQIIKDAKAQGKKYHNFWGIADDEENKKHPWYGLTLFKKGFGGYRTDYLHAQDLPLNKKYWLSWAVDKYRLIKRGV